MTYNDIKEESIHNRTNVTVEELANAYILANITGFKIDEDLKELKLFIIDCENNGMYRHRCGFFLDKERNCYMCNRLSIENI